MNIFYVRTLILQYLIAVFLSITIMYMVGMFITFDIPTKWDKFSHSSIRTSSLITGVLGPMCMWSKNEAKYSTNKDSK